MGRTGEILDAAVAIPELWARGDRRLVREDLNTASAWPALDATKRALGLDPRACTFATDALAEVEFGLDLLVARGEMAPDGPDAEAFVLASLKEVTMHEVGPHARTAPQLPRVDRVPAGPALRPRVHLAPTASPAR